MTKNDDDRQIREFAKRFAHANRAAWHAYVPDVREALIDAFVLLVVLGQGRTGVQVDEIRSLRCRLGARLAARHQMPNPIADVHVIARSAIDVEDEIDAMSDDGRIGAIAKRLAIEAGADWPSLDGEAQDAWHERAIEHVRAGGAE